MSMNCDDWIALRKYRRSISKEKARKFRHANNVIQRPLPLWRSSSIF